MVYKNNKRRILRFPRVETCKQQSPMNHLRTTTFHEFHHFKVVILIFCLFVLHSLPHTPPFNSWEGEGLSFLPYVSILARLWFVGPFLCVLHIYINTMVLHIVRGWKLFNFLYFSDKISVFSSYLLFQSGIWSLPVWYMPCCYLLKLVFMNFGSGIQLDYAGSV